jgi:hypothetical protein
MNKCPCFAIVVLASLLAAATARASLTVRVDEPKFTGSKAIVKLTMHNTYTNAVESARAVVFVMNDKGKVTGQRVEWVIGGTKDKPGLAPNATAEYNMVVDTDKAVTKAKVTFTRIILNDGRVIDAGQGFKIEP